MGYIARGGDIFVMLDGFLNNDFIKIKLNMWLTAPKGATPVN